MFTAFCIKMLVEIGSVQGLKQFLGQFNTSPENEGRYQPLFDSIFSVFPFFLSAKRPREIFVFSGRNSSGIRLTSQEELPKNGFCFCGSIRIERKDQSKTRHLKPMTIFKLASPNENEIELYLANGYLNYRVISPIIIRSMILEIIKNQRYYSTRSNLKMTNGIS